MNGYEDLVESWLLSLRARNLAPKTLAVYSSSLRNLLHHAQPDADLTTADVERFLADLAGRCKPATVSVHYRALQQFFAWLAAEDDVPNPMAAMRAPIVPEQPVPVLTLDQLRALIATCDGKTLPDRRDAAAIRLFADTGARLSEVAGIAVDDVDVRAQVVRVLGKGRRERFLPFGTRTAQALDRYRRVRARHRHAADPALWLGDRGGPMTSNGLYQAIKRRGREAGIVGLHPHQLRHTAAHMWLSADGSEGDLMQLMGWRSRSMLSRYGASAAALRARDAHRRLGLGDKF